MKNKKYILSFTASVLVHILVFSQSENIIPQNSILYKFSTPIPGKYASNKGALSSLQIFTNQQSNIFNEIRYDVFHADVRYNKSQFTLFGERKQEGKYIRYTNLYSGYGVHIQLNNSYYLSGEINAGLVSASFGEPTTTDYGSDINLDFRTFVRYYSTNNYLEFGLGHINTPELKPVQYIIENRFTYNFLYIHKINTVNTFNGKGMLYYNFEDKIHELSIGALIEYKKFIGLGVIIQSKGDLLFTAELNIETKHVPLELIIGYEVQSLLSQKIETTDMFEIGMNINFN